MSAFGLFILLAWVGAVGIAYFERWRAIARGEITLLGHTTYRDKEPASFQLYLRLRYDLIIAISVVALVLILTTSGGRNMLSW